MAKKRINIDLDQEPTIDNLETLAFLAKMKLKPFIEKILTDYAQNNEIKIEKKPKDQ